MKFLRRGIKLRKQVYDLYLEKERLRKAYFTVNEEICQTLGKVLGYPWFKDDLKNFPDATEKDGVCVVAETIAEEAAQCVQKLQKENCALTKELILARGEPIPKADFDKHLERTTEKVSKMPDWKQNVITGRNWCPYHPNQFVENCHMCRRH